MTRKGYILAFTGNGKGKTTAALGTAVRTLLAGKRVFFGQFIKGEQTAELSLGDYLPGFTIRQFGQGNFVMGKPSIEDVKSAREGMAISRAAIGSGEYDLVVLDEIFVALHYNLLETEDVLALLESKPEPVDIILTGRYASDTILEKADLVTVMQKHKHYFDIGVPAREGIEY